MIFQWPSTARRKYFRCQAAVVGTESGLGWCSQDRGSARRWALYLGHEFESFLFTLLSHKKKPAKSNIGWLKLPSLPRWPGASWLPFQVVGYRSIVPPKACLAGASLAS